MKKLTTLLTVLACTACSGGAESVARKDPGSVAPMAPLEAMSAARTVAELVDGDAPMVSGVLDCIGGDWTVFAWRLQSATRRDARGLPSHPPEVAAPLGSPGAYTIPVPAGPRRFVAAVEARSGAIAWSDPEGRALPVHGDIARLDLSCELHPTPEGTEVVPQGEPVTDALVEEAKRPVRIVSKDGGPPTLEAQLKRSDRGSGGVHTERLIRARYAHRLSPEELRAHMPMLLQLADDPAAADEFVRGISRSSGSRHL